MHLRRLTSCAVAAALLWQWPVILTPMPAYADEALPSEGRVVIEEVAWAGSSTSTLDEWIEFVNLGETTTTIAGWSLHGAGEGGRIIFLPQDAAIAPHATYIVSNYPESDPKCTLSVPVNLATSTVSLSNSALGVELRDANDVVIDRAGSGKAPPAGSVTPKATMIRASATSSGDQLTDWMSATTTAGFDEGVTDFGTPGFCDLCVTTSVVSNVQTDDAATDIVFVTTSTTDPVGADPCVRPDQCADTASSTETTGIENLDPSVDATSSTESMSTADGADTWVRPYGDADTTTSTETTVTTESSSASNTNASVQTPHAPLVITLNEIMSNPASGKEWVELFVHDADATSTDRVLELWDASSRIATITKGTPVNAERYFVVTLSSARLNNDGDSLSLMEQSGAILDATAIPALEKGVAWARLVDTVAWAETDIATPGLQNAFPIPVVTVASASTNVSTAATSSTVTQSVTTPVVNQPVAVTTVSSTHPLLRITLNEIMSHPAEGKEWVELRIDDVTATSTDRVLELWDGSGRIMTIPALAPLASPSFLTVTLASARLNNSGDELSLRELTGIVLDTTKIPALNAGTSWSRIADSNEWTGTDQPTPGTANETPNAAAILLDETSGGTTTSIAFNATMKQTASKQTTDKTASLTHLSFDSMYDPELDTVRVRVTGTVGSVDRLLGATHAFILHGADGRGVIVYLPTHLNIPPFGATVRVMGTLTSTYRGPELRMKASDVWMTVATTTPPLPRSVDLLAPGTEDAWSLVEATGTVLTVATRSFTIDADGVEVVVSIPTAVKYRTKRLVKGDVVHVTALLDLRKDNPALLPRTPEEIELIGHAPSTITSPTASTGTASGPDWKPFGAAAGVLAMTGAAKRVNEIWKRRRLAAQAAKATASITS
jgi:hypothetical protein